jgi:hypothetical protein
MTAQLVIWTTTKQNQSKLKCTYEAIELVTIFDENLGLSNVIALPSRVETIDAISMSKQGTMLIDDDNQ